MTPRPLEDAWREVLDSVLARRGAPAIGDVSRLAPRLAELSRLYNEDAARPRVPLEARIAFSFTRDVPKGAGAVRELVASGALCLPEDRALRVVDLGAGLGAMTWGVARALRDNTLADAPKYWSARSPGIEALFVDDDGEALTVAEAIAAEARSRIDGPPLAVRTRREAISEKMALPDADLVLLGQTLSELDHDLDASARVDKHAALLRRLLASVSEHGSVVVVEPALKSRARHLHAVRDRLASSVFAPCLHAGPCPALASEGDWCHDDLAVDLPGWLVPLARAAGLRWQGLTFAYVVLRRDGRTLSGELPPPGPSRLRLRVVSDRLVSKGKVELFGCTEAGERRRLRRLDRDVGDGEPELARGDVVTIDGPVDDRGRIGREVGIDVWRGRN